MESWRIELYQNELMHAGIKGQKWGVRRFQYEDGTLTPEGRRRYSERTGVRRSSESSTARNLNDEQARQNQTKKYKEAIGRSLETGDSVRRVSGTLSDGTKYYDVVTTARNSPFGTPNRKADQFTNAGRERLAQDAAAARATAYARQHGATFAGTSGEIARIYGANEGMKYAGESIEREKEEALKRANKEETFLETMSRYKNVAVNTITSAASSVSSFVSRTANTVVNAASSAFNSAVSAGEAALKKLFGR